MSLPPPRTGRKKFRSPRELERAVCMPCLYGSPDQPEGPFSPLKFKTQIS
uniref:Uncharacterized protein n=1 Tax=Anopheles dirus TaxID=7168 RepID=A0A182NVY0_9DIPT